MIALVVGGVGYYYATNQGRIFLAEAFAQLDGGAGVKHLETMHLESGESFKVILDHACCSGAGFDAVAIYTSDGEKYYSTKNYCGIEGFYAAIQRSASKDLDQLKNYLVTQDYTKK